MLMFIETPKEKEGGASIFTTKKQLNGIDLF